jgi:RNA polymerase sigma-70 factor, ECF subfamily
VPLPLKMKTSERDREAPGRSLLSPPETSRGLVTPRVPSFSSVYRQYFDFIWSTARRFGVEAESIDDLVQEVFIVIHAKLDTLERPEALRSWVYGIVRRTVSTYRRSRRAHAASGITRDVLPDIPSRDRTPLEQTEQNAAVRLLADLLDQLEEPKREVFALVELEQWTVPEVAEALEIPLNTAYSRLRAARQGFEAALARHEAKSKGK